MHVALPDSQTRLPVVDGCVGEEGQVGGELAPDPGGRQIKGVTDRRMHDQRHARLFQRTRLSALQQDGVPELLFLAETSSSVSQAVRLDF